MEIAFSLVYAALGTQTMGGILQSDVKSSIERRYLRTLFVVISCCLLTPNFLVSQNNAPATIEGTIIDATSGKPLSGVRMQIGPGSRSVLKDAEGKFVLTGVAPGAYVLSGQKPGYMNLRREGMRTPGNSGVPLVLKAGERLQSEFQPEQIWMFGSHAWGTPTDDSDVDLMVILSQSSEPTLKRAQRVHL